jgi:hypothetical protein
VVCGQGSKTAKKAGNSSTGDIQVRWVQTRSSNQVGLPHQAAVSGLCANNLFEAHSQEASTLEEAQASERRSC